jgi:hypothetical protein
MRLLLMLARRRTLRGYPDRTKFTPPAATRARSIASRDVARGEVGRASEGGHAARRASIGRE